MTSTIIILRKLRNSEWQMYSPKGNPIGPIFRGDKYKAKDWAKAFISSFHNWTLLIEGEDSEKED